MIINKAGGLIFNRTFQEGGLNQLSSNDYLVIAGTFHGYEDLPSSPHREIPTDSVRAS